MKYIYNTYVHPNNAAKIDLISGRERSELGRPGQRSVYPLLSLHPPRHGRHRHVLQPHAGKGGVGRHSPWSETWSTQDQRLAHQHLILRNSPPLTQMF